MTPGESSSLLVTPPLGCQVGVAGDASPAEPCPGSQGKLCVREEGEKGAISPCHQGHQRGQEDRWDQSDHGRHLCQEHHQHLWDQHPPKDTGKPETSGVEQGGDLQHPACVWDPSPAYVCPAPTCAKNIRTFRGKMPVWGFIPSGIGEGSMGQLVSLPFLVSGVAHSPWLAAISLDFCCHVSSDSDPCVSFL